MALPKVSKNDHLDKTIELKNIKVYNLNKRKTNIVKRRGKIVGKKKDERKI